jgi:hypothetical protein
VFDRYHLAYLNVLEKLNCAYANGLIAYVREIAGRTEQYWCPIKHARRVIGAHSHYAHGTSTLGQQRLIGDARIVSPYPSAPNVTLRCAARPLASNRYGMAAVARTST